MVTLENTKDPLVRYTSAPGDSLEQACGLIPFFWMDALLNQADTAEDVMDSMVESYGFGRMEFKGCMVAEDGTYVSEFEEDPDLAPYLKLGAVFTDEDTGECENVVECWVYPYGILAVRDLTTPPTIVRMD